MNQEDYPSDCDASDADFRPDEEEPDTGSELDSNDEEPEDQSTAPKGSQKRKRKSNTTSRKRTKGRDKPPAKAHQGKAAQSEDEEKDDELDEEEEKRRTDALWADFLGGGSSSSSSTTNVEKTPKAKVAEVKKSVPEVKSTPTAKAPENKKPTVAQLFEFAGEQIVLTEDTNGKSNEAVSTVPKPAAPKTVAPRAGGGLGSVLSQISKKTQLSTLEKTKLDWTSFKRSQGIEEELQTHNKGKDGFLERRDFLERTDLRQFEIEKTFRQTKRSNR
ncbi:craniofacial development protein 1 [Anopheles stephensi]|uniref:craniofacial development protein 1 n=1 Tax=Anopheles stephensi TaxID=30069 RepID=UPI001658BFC0|nr:craniofacial development protein 1 [Anopheles stephensi]